MPELRGVYQENPMAHYMIDEHGELFEIFTSCHWCGAVKPVTDEKCGRCKQGGWNNGN